MKRSECSPGSLLKSAGQPTLDELYVRHLHLGFIVLRQAIDSSDSAWVNAEHQLLHNIPSLIGEPNLRRHHYFWASERTWYINWITASGSDQAKSRMNTFYMPHWKEMEPVIVAAIKGQ